MTLTRRTALALLASAAALPAFGQAAPIPLDRISAYLNGIRTAEADFTQINADGTTSSGRLYIHRPNRMRFEYDPPDELLVLASAGQVAIFDSKATEQAEEYPLSRTPLKHILGANIDLGRAKMVVGHGSDGHSTTVVLQDPANPDYGTLRLIFTDAPLELRQWVVTDEYGGETAVLLGPLARGQSYPASHFSIVAERNDRRGR